jgi:hypothetical protein
VAEPTWKPHLRPTGTASSRDYVYVATGGPDAPPPPAYPARNRLAHGQALSAQLDALEKRRATLSNQRTLAGVEATGSTVTAEVDLNRDFDPEKRPAGASGLDA